MKPYYLNKKEMRKMVKYEEHQFYCLLCGRPGIPLRRKTGFKHEAFHRKKLYCPFCKKEVNHIEIKSFSEREEFLENFKYGVYKDEAKESYTICGNSSVG